MCELGKHYYGAMLPVFGVDTVGSPEQHVFFVTCQMYECFSPRSGMTKLLFVDEESLSSSLLLFWIVGD